MPQWSVHFETRVDTRHPEIVSLVASAHALARVIARIPLPPGIRDRLHALNILRAVRGTTGIEGSELTEDEVRQVLRTPSDRSVLPPAKKREELETRNAYEVMQFIVSILTENPARPLTEDLIRTIHRLTTKDIDYENNVPGEYRHHAAHAGEYVPPRTGDEVRNLMAQFITWFNQGEPAHWDPAVRAVVAHFYLVSIHPFGDGNGRTARAVESLLLYQGRLNARGFYSLANYYYRRRDQYIHMLDYVRFETGGDLTPFTLFALRGFIEELEDVHQEVLAEVRVIAFRDFAREWMALHPRPGPRVQQRMLEFLFGLGNEPVFISELRHGIDPLASLYRHVTMKTLTRDLNFLKQHALITIKGDELRANLDYMDQFTPPSELLPRARRLARS